MERAWQELSIDMAVCEPISKISENTTWSRLTYSPQNGYRSSPKQEWFLPVNSGKFFVSKLFFIPVRKAIRALRKLRSGYLRSEVKYSETIKEVPRSRSTGNDLFPNTNILSLVPRHQYRQILSLRLNTTFDSNFENASKSDALPETCK